ncbi:hypothetical protein AnigIFM60653_001452 [Aspergillus niger]|nr:hypothetical protein AnigIFM50267_002559 [Aspergillus niger]GLA10067.1 hypothetical protein AnigIFM60653_001452 [Aspergillus niger]
MWKFISQIDTPPLKEAVLLVDIPGTADSPAAPNDPESPDRLWSSVLDWVDEHKDQYDFNPSQILARGISTGGYYAMRIAHTHADRLLAVVAQGGGSHHMFDPEWIRAQNHMEYPFALAEALAQQFGYTDVQKYAAGNARERLSLLESGILDNGCTWLLLINGMEDSIFLIEDSILPLQHGRMKESRLDSCSRVAEVDVHQNRQLLLKTSTNNYIKYFLDHARKLILHISIISVSSPNNQSAEFMQYAGQSKIDKVIPEL